MGGGGRLGEVGEVARLGLYCWPPAPGGEYSSTTLASGGGGGGGARAKSTFLILLAVLVLSVVRLSAVKNCQISKVTSETNK